MIYIAWTSGGDRPRVQWTYSRDGGASFSPPLGLASLDATSENARILADTRDIVHLVYACESVERRKRHVVRYTQLRIEPAVLGPDQVISGSLLLPFRSVNFPEIATDDRGHLVVIWDLLYDERSNPGRLQYVVLSACGDRLCEPDGVVIPYCGSRQGPYMKKLAMNSDGKVALVSTEFILGKVSRIWLKRGCIEAQAEIIQSV